FVAFLKLMYREILFFSPRNILDMVIQYVKSNVKHSSEFEHAGTSLSSISSWSVHHGSTRRVFIAPKAMLGDGTSLSKGSILILDMCKLSSRLRTFCSRSPSTRVVFKRFSDSGNWRNTERGSLIAYMYSRVRDFDWKALKIANFCFEVGGSCLPSQYGCDWNPNILSRSLIVYLGLIED
ncbi:hypothetical protein BDQ17DRAFT_1362872, partial [Cyathus striatus]